MCVCLHEVACVYVFDPLLHHTVMKAEIGWRGAFSVREKTHLCVSVRLLWGVVESSTRASPYLCLASTGLGTRSHHQTTFSISARGSSFSGTMTESRMNPQGCTSGENTKGVRDKAGGKDREEDNGEMRQVKKKKYGAGRQIFTSW